MVASAAVPDSWLGCDLCIKKGADVLCFIIFNQRLNTVLWGQECIDSGKLFTVLFWNFSNNQTPGRRDRSGIPASTSPADLKPYTQLLYCAAFLTETTKGLFLSLWLRYLRKDSRYLPCSLAFSSQYSTGHWLCVGLTHTDLIDLDNVCYMTILFTAVILFYRKLLGMLIWVGYFYITNCSESHFISFAFWG